MAEKIGNIDAVYEAVGHSHFALQALQVLGTNGIFVLTGVPGLQAFIEADPARLMRNMVLQNQVLLGTVNAGRRPSPPRSGISTCSAAGGRRWCAPSSPGATRPSRRRI